MNWDAIGALGELIGALAVICTLVYLAVQIRQNTNAVKSAATESSVKAVNDVRLVLSQDSELVDIYLKGIGDPSLLSPAEEVRFRVFIQCILWSAWNLFQQARLSGNPDIWETQEAVLCRVLKTNGGIWFLKNFGNEFDSEFRAEIERLAKISDDDT